MAEFEVHYDELFSSSVSSPLQRAPMASSAAVYKSPPRGQLIRDFNSPSSSSAAVFNSPSLRASNPLVSSSQNSTPRSRKASSVLNSPPPTKRQLIRDFNSPSSSSAAVFNSPSRRAFNPLVSSSPNSTPRSRKASSVLKSPPPARSLTEEEKQVIRGISSISF